MMGPVLRETAVSQTVLILLEDIDNEERKQIQHGNYRL